MELFKTLASGFKSFLVFPKSFILDIWLSPEYTFASIERWKVYHIEGDEKKNMLQYLMLSQSVFHRQFLFTYIFFTSLKFGACYITHQWGKFRVKNATLCFHILLWHFFVAFYKIIFIYFSDEVSNFCDKILTNLKPELMIRNCQWNCMHNIDL